MLAAKALTAIITVLIGVSAALVLYWLLNKLAEILPERMEARLKPFLYILPAYVAIVFYLVYPAVQTIIYSFKDSASQNWVGWQNYTSLLSNSGFQQTLLNTLLWMVVVPVVTVALGLGVAVLADRLNPRAESTAKTIIFLPMAISMVGAGTVWKFVYDYAPAGRPQIGLQNAIVTGLGHAPVPWLQQQQFHFNSFLLMVMLLWAQVGFSMVLLSAAVKGVPGDTLEAARIDGAGERQIFFSVVVPQIWGTIITVFITTLISVMKIFDIIYVMTNGNFNTNVLGNEFFNQLFKNFNNGASSAIVVMLLIAMIPIMIYQVRHFRNEEAAA
ncbi:MAG: alpha-glucoside transport system permease protein [Nocardioidaceae bacterium]|jgi:alpha-glucoside transport system permease protein|nr:alpha-glucoside transport system permease protein [Nocardioidaceae bacterium]